MSRALPAIALILDLLVEVPITIRKATKKLSVEELGRRTDPGQWSTGEILAHLRASDDLHGQRIGILLQEHEPRIVNVHLHEWPTAACYATVPFNESFVAYVEQRQRLVTRLRALDQGGWQRGGTLAEIRPERHITVHSEANALALHEVRHLGQVKRQVKQLQTSN